VIVEIRSAATSGSPARRGEHFIPGREASTKGGGGGGGVMKVREGRDGFLPGRKGSKEEGGEGDEGRRKKEPTK
jgi:hypothetical protein